MEGYISASLINGLGSSPQVLNSEQFIEQGRFLPLKSELVNTFTTATYNYFLLVVVNVLYCICEVNEKP